MLARTIKEVWLHKCTVIFFIKKHNSMTQHKYTCKYLCNENDKNMCQYKSLSQQNCNRKIFFRYFSFTFFVMKLKTSVGNFSATNTESKGKQLKVSQFAYQSYQLKSIFFLQKAIGLNFYFSSFGGCFNLQIAEFFFFAFCFLILNWIFNVNRKQEELKNF